MKSSKFLPQKTHPCMNPHRLCHFCEDRLGL